MTTVPTSPAGGTQKEQRLELKLRTSPGSYFIERARDLVLAPEYFYSRLPDNTYTGTSTAHKNRLCETTYASVLSAFELTWKTMFGLIVDLTPMYDKRLLNEKSTKDSVQLESLLAHRGENSIGHILAASLGVWQQPRMVNERFKALMEIEPLSSAHASELVELWQIRHVVAHNAGVITPLDAHRLNDMNLTGKSLRIDFDFLSKTERQLGTILRSGCQQVHKRVLCGAKEQRDDGKMNDEEVAPLLLAASIVNRSDPPTLIPLPEVASQLESHHCDRCS